MTTTLKHSLLSCLMGLALAAPASAGMSTKWWGGDWRCTIDGRPANMRWIPIETSNGFDWKGRFSDNGSAWVALTFSKEGSSGGLNFRHTDGNHWYLPRPVDNQTNGYTTWNGQRYPLSCWR